MITNNPHIKKLNNLKKSILCFDVETSARYSDGKKIDIRADFENYVKYAKVKWIGFYSYKYDKYVCDEVKGNEERIKSFISEHDILCGFNNEEFDTPIMYNNDLMPENKRYLQIDNLIILGASSFQKRDGLPFKNRGKLMGYKLRRNSLKAIAEVMELETQKGDIDYNIFFQENYTEQERQDILKYLESDVKITKQMLDKLWEFWMPFTEFLYESDVLNLSWIRSSISSLRYKGDCCTLGVEATYGEKSGEKEEMGGRVIPIKYEEARKVWYLDFSSLYPWIRNIFAIDNEVSKEKATVNVLDDVEFHGIAITQNGFEPEFSVNEEHLELKNDIFHQNKLFQTKGYYDVSHQNPIALKSIENLKLRAKLKKEDPTNSLIYAIKIYENAGYGAMRSRVFEQIHTPNAGWDICYLGQQFQKYVEKRMLDFGFETIAGDTDSIFIIANDPIVNNTEARVQYCLNIIIKEILENVPFPDDTFNIDIEHFIEYIMWPFSEQPIQWEDGTNIKNEKGRLVKERKGKKKNYCYLYFQESPFGYPELKLKLVGLPIIKDNATKLGPKIFEEVLRPRIISEKQAKFDASFIKITLQEYLRKPDSLALLAREFKVKAVSNYKLESQIQAQISAGYFNGGSGVISLIKNKKCGKAGKTSKYCTVEEAVENKLGINDLDLDKVEKELKPFVRYEK